MRCFNHPEHEAIGVCRNCGRGVCGHCVAIVGDAVACSGRCEQRVATIQKEIDRDSETLQTVAQSWRRSGVNTTFTGILYAVMGVIFMRLVDGNGPGLYLGAVFIALGVLVFMRGVNAMFASRKYHELAISASNQDSN